VHVVAARRAVSMDTLQQAAGGYASRIRSFVMQSSDDGTRDTVTVTFHRLPASEAAAIAQKLSALPGVISAAVGGADAIAE